MLANAIYLFALASLSPWILYRRLRHGRYRRGWRQKLLGISADEARRLIGENATARCIWLHAVSVGEVNLLGGVIDGLKERYPQTPIVVSSSTDTGYDLAVTRFGAKRVFFCPLDFSWAVRRTLRSLNPCVLVLAELELWPNLIKNARKNDSEVIVINGRLSDRSAAGYQRFSQVTRPIFAALRRVECQDESSAEKFAACGTPRRRIGVSGSLKFDNAPETRDSVEVQSRCRWAGVDPWHRVWVFGSTQEGEEQIALDVYRRLCEEHQELRLILVPRHRERFGRVAQLIESSKLNPHRRSCDGSMQPLDWPPDRVVLIDTIGELSHWWGVGQIATVGGSFGDRGGQNMLEPAGYGSAISFGPNTRNFADIAQRLLDADGAVRVDGAFELQQFVLRCLTDVPAADALGRAAKKVVQSHLGATERTLGAISDLIGQPVAEERESA
jgi:3-deoxy-D-manno-octulosonic-acid transferase